MAEFDVDIGARIWVKVDSEHPAMDAGTAAAIALGRLNDVFSFLEEMGSIDGYQIMEDSMEVTQ